MFSIALKFDGSKVGRNCGSFIAGINQLFAKFKYIHNLNIQRMKISASVDSRHNRQEAVVETQGQAQHTDRVAEVHNTLRKGLAVTLQS